MLHYEEVKASEPDSKHLMIVLHGLGDSIEGYRWLPSMLKLPWLNYALVNAPDDYFGGFSWYDLQGNAHPGIVRSRDLLFELVDHFRTKGYESKKIFFLGFSQGCLMTWEVGMRYPHPLAGCVGISGYIHQSETLLSGASAEGKNRHFLITHGQHDPLIPLAPVKVEVEKMQQNGIDAEWMEFAKEHTIAGEEELDVIRQFVVKHRQIDEKE
jgi:phospholipase/carboxylesterase